MNEFSQRKTNRLKYKTMLALNEETSDKNSG